MAKTYPWGGFANGLIPDVFLTKVRGEWFEKEAAAHLVQLEAAFTAHFGYPAVIVQGYRARGKPSDKPGVPTQWGLYNEYKTTDPLRAAYPGTSPHGYARSADFASGVDQYGSQQKEWMDANAPAFGWHPTGNTFPRKEAWHYDYIPGTATASLTATTLEDDMPTTEEVVNGLLNHAAYDGGPTVSVVLKGVFEAIFTGGTSMPGGKSIATLLGEAASNGGANVGADVKQILAAVAAINAVVQRPVKRDGKDIEQIQDNADTNTMVRELLARTGAVVPSGVSLTQEQVTQAVTAALATLTLKATS